MRTPQDVEALVTTLLTLEAEQALQQEAEADLTSPLAGAWFGHGVAPDRQAAAKARLALVEAQHASAMRCFSRCPTPAFGAAVDHWREAVADADAALAALEAEIEGAITTTRATLVAERVEELRTKYLRWSERLYRIDPFHPALPPRMQQWLYRQQQLRRFESPNNRLLAALEIRESTLHAWAFSILPLRDEEEGMENVFPFASKQEERLERVLEQQFCHPNGDRRTDRPDRWRRDDAYDFAIPDYDGTPHLAALPHEPRPCSHCGAEIKDGVRVDLWLDPEVDYTPDTIWRAAVGFKVCDAYCECAERVVDYVSLEGGPASYEAFEAAKKAAYDRLKAFHERRGRRFATAA